jgi:hypothetical protein
METMESTILTKMRRQGRGAVSCNKDFLDLGSRAAIDQALNRLAKRGDIRRIARGIYYNPARSATLGELSPDLVKVAEAAARKSGATIAPTEAAAANALGLSTQVPAKAIFLTDRRLRPITVKNRTIQFRQVAPRILRAHGEIGSLLLQAMRYLGKDRLDDDAIQKLRERLTPQQRKSFANDAKYSLDWIAEIAQKIAL